MNNNQYDLSHINTDRIILDGGTPQAFIEYEQATIQHKKDTADSCIKGILDNWLFKG